MANNHSDQKLNGASRIFNDSDLPEPVKRALNTSPVNQLHLHTYHVQYNSLPADTWHVLLPFVLFLTVFLAVISIVYTTGICLYKHHAQKPVTQHFIQSSVRQTADLEPQSCQITAPVRRYYQREAWHILNRINRNCSTNIHENRVNGKNFADGWEKEGAAIAIYHKGKLVVDLYGGYADKSALIKWTENTKTIVFSASKAVGSLAIAMLVDRGHIQYNDKISKYWPEFAQNGKADITLQWIMTHQAGLAVLDHFVTLEEAYQPELIAKILEKQKPNWEPGTKTGYHAITYGWLVDLIIRRVDPLKRGIAQFVREEITKNTTSIFTWACLLSRIPVFLG
uniref:Beta-lactamase-related domain-containing protein n=1 Tax=Ditylenchus dipsaci TaxID=166011 RepID=A0A915CZX0_9BILA